MYGHQVIEDCKNIDISRSNTENIHLYAGIIKNLCNQINLSSHFNLGRADDIYEIFKKNEGKILFLDLLSENIKLPYKKCWFDYESGQEDKSDTDPRDRSSKRGVLVFEVYPDIFECYIFTYMDYFRQWMPPFLHYLICIGKKISDHNIKNELISLVNKKESDVINNLNTNILPIPLVEYDFSRTKAIINEDNYDLSILNTALLLLSCKNITTELHEAPAKLNKARAKKGKQPLFSYHTLKLMPLSQKVRSTQGEPTGDHYRLHLCRGHFKRFTEDKPLFGKLTELYWWQPHLRGRIRADLWIRIMRCALNERERQ